MKISHKVFSVALILIWAGNAFPLGFLHTFHTSLTRIDYREKEKLVEISVQLFSHDLVPALERRAKKQIDLEKTPDIDKILFDYFNDNFVLQDKTGKSKELTWIGKEVSVDTVYIYVEVSSEENLEGCKLRNTFFFESFPEQTNRVVARYADKKADLLFKAGDVFKEIKLNKSVEEN